MRAIPPSLRAKKNLRYTGGAYLKLWKIQLRDNLFTYLVNNPEEITFRGEKYEPARIDFEIIDEQISGDLPFVNVAVANPHRAGSAILENYDGLRDQLAFLYIVNEDLLAEDEAAFEYTFQTRKTDMNDKAITAELSVHRFLRLRFPRHRMIRNRCRFQFKDPVGCKFGQGNAALAALSAFCSREFDGPNGCIFHGTLEESLALVPEHPKRFGGAIGIPKRRGP